MIQIDLPKIVFAIEEDIIILELIRRQNDRPNFPLLQYTEEIDEILEPYEVLDKPSYKAAIKKVHTKTVENTLSSYPPNKALPPQTSTRKLPPSHAKSDQLCRNQDLGKEKS